MKRAMTMLVVVLFVMSPAITPTAAVEVVKPTVPKEKIMLWNGKDFAGWKLFIPDKSVDVHDVWSVKDGVVHCKGVPNGYMRTKAQYANYRLHVEWRWPEKPSNSGVLLHRRGEDQSFPLCIEAQLKGGNAGDLVMMSGGALTVTAMPAVSASS